MAQQQIITKPYVGELQVNDSLFINHDGALRQIKKSDADFASGADMRAEVAAREAFEAKEVAAREAFEKSETEAREQFKTSVGEQIAEKANVDGYYEEMTVGDAEQLVATQFVEDNEPYLFRSTGGSSDVGNRTYLDKIVGGTVAWNQMITVQGNSLTLNGVTRTGDTANGTVIFNGTASADIGSQSVGELEFTNSLSYKRRGHVILITVGNESLPFKFGLAGYAIQYTRSFMMKESANSDWNNSLVVWITEGTVLNNVVLKPQAFDLTQMFGSTIADYIYSLEQSQAGAGVAWFKKLFPKDYYPYSAGELLSVEGLQSHDTVGFNQWDKNTMVVENVHIDDVDGAEKSNTRTLSTDFIPVIPNTDYFINTEQTAGGWGAWYDADKNYISGITGYANVKPTHKVKTAPDNAHYMRLTCRYNNNGNVDTFCVNLSDQSRNGEYEPYEKHSYPLDSSLTLRGIPKLDASNNLYYDGDEYTSNGIVTRKYGVVDLGTIDWVQGGGGNKTSWVPVSWRNNVKPVRNIDNKANILCNKYHTDTAEHVEKQVNDKTISVNKNSWVYIYDIAYVSVTPQEFKTAMSGVYLIYELATPTTETAEPFQHIQIVDDFGTEEFVNTGIVPVGHKTRYPANLRDKLQHLPSLANADGTYLIRQTGKQMSLVRMPAVLPEVPTEDGTYTLKTVVTGGVATLQWVTE